MEYRQTALTLVGNPKAVPVLWKKALYESVPPETAGSLPWKEVMH